MINYWHCTTTTTAAHHTTAGAAAATATATTGAAVATTTAAPVPHAAVTGAAVAATTASTVTLAAIAAVTAAIATSTTAAAATTATAQAQCGCTDLTIVNIAVDTGVACHRFGNRASLSPTPCCIVAGPTVAIKQTTHVLTLCLLLLVEKHMGTTARTQRDETLTSSR